MELNTEQLTQQIDKVSESAGEIAKDVGTTAIPFIQQNSGLIIKAIIILIIIFAFVKVFKNIKSKVNRKIYEAKSALRQITRMSGVGSETEALRSIAQGMMDTVEPKSVGGSTSIYLKQIQRDFPDYHNEDAENAIKIFITEYLNIKYGTQQDFTKSKINGKILTNIDKFGGEIDGIKFNGMAIYKYTKTVNFATVVYKCSVGFNHNGKRVETRYEVDYTLQLANDNIANLSMKCPNCGAAYDNTNNLTCPYCGASIIKDTILNWFITEITEI